MYIHRKLDTFSMGIRKMDIHPGGNRIYVQCCNDPQTHCVEILSGIIIQTLGSRVDNLTVQHSNRSQLVVSACGSIIFTAHNYEINGWNYLNGTRITSKKISPTDADTLSIGKHVFISSIAIHPKNSALLSCTLHGYGGMDGAIMILLNIKAEPIVSPDMMKSADDSISYTWHQIRKDVLEDDPPISSFNDILDRIDNLLHMAIKSPNQTDDYKENIIKQKGENVDMLLCDPSRTHHSADAENGRQQCNSTKQNSRSVSTESAAVVKQSTNRTDTGSGSINTFTIEDTKNGKDADTAAFVQLENATPSPSHSNETFSIGEGVNKTSGTYEIVPPIDCQNSYNHASNTSLSDSVRA